MVGGEWKRALVSCGSRTRALAITLVAVAGLCLSLGMLSLIGGGRLPDVDRLGDSATVVAADVALVARVGFDEFSFGGHGQVCPTRQ
jgi:hypothetical protein